MRNNLAIRLTEQQEKFVAEVVRGNKPEAAAMLAGYGGNSRQISWALLRNPAIVAAIRIEITRLLTAEALPLAYRVLTDIAKDETAPVAVRRACARDLIDRAGIVPPKAAENGAAGAEKPMSEMSTSELRALVDRLESELGARAVDVTPSSDKAQKPKAPIVNRLKFLE